MSVRNVVRDQLSMDAARIDLEAAEWPFVQTLKPHTGDRSQQQNRLSHAWYKQVSKTTGEDTPAGVKGYCKLHFGVPILRGDSEQFCDMYDRLIKPNPSYEWKLDIMSQPDIFPITSLLTTTQMSDYMTHMQQYYASRPVDPVQLNFPEDLR